MWELNEMSTRYTIGEIGCVHIYFDYHDDRIYMDVHGPELQELSVKQIDELIESLKSRRKIWDRNER